MVPRFEVYSGSRRRYCPGVGRLAAAPGVRSYVNGRSAARASTDAAAMGSGESRLRAGIHGGAGRRPEGWNLASLRRVA